jgi:hypothetical protein
MTVATSTTLAASQIKVSPSHLGITRGADAPEGSIEITNRLLQRNHDELHIFFRDMNGHNHLVHNLLTRLALGATPEQLQVAFDDDLPTQRPMPPLDEEVVRNLSNEDYFCERITKIGHYTNFMRFFEQQIEAKGWQAVVNEYVFSRSRIAEALLPLMYDGAFHSIIHLGLGAEFAQPSVIAEALAQAAAHDSFETDWYFQTCEKKAEALKDQPSPSLMELLGQLQMTDAITAAAKTPGFIGTMKMKKCLFANAGEEITSLAAQFRVTEENLERRTAESISFCAYLAGATQRPDKTYKVDFFFMHCVTSSIFFSVLIQQPWISTADKVRLVEWKGWLDLAWYAVCGAPKLDIAAAEQYQGTPSGNWSWNELFSAVNDQHDDGHVAKFVRALKNGEEASKPFVEGEGSDAFPLKGDTWLKIARMSYDTTLGLPPPAKWVIMAGMDQAWAPVPARK